MTLLVSSSFSTKPTNPDRVTRRQFLAGTAAMMTVPYFVPGTMDEGRWTRDDGRLIGTATQPVDAESVAVVKGT